MMRCKERLRTFFGIVEDQSGYVSTIQVSVYDALGKLVLSSIENGAFEVDLGDVPEGIYTLRLDNEAGSLTRKLVKQ